MEFFICTLHFMDYNITKEMKKIAIFVQSITIEYSIEILTGIADFYKDKDVKLIIGQIKAPSSAKGIYEYQNWSAAHYLISDDIDGILLVAGGFPSETIHNNLVPLLKQFKSKPVVSITTDLEYDNLTYTHTDCEEAYNDIIHHLKTKHGCKRFAFMTAALRHASESEERFNAFKKALKKNGLSFNKNLVLDSDFTPQTSKEIILNRYKSKKDINFDAIISASDLMATGIYEAFEELDVKIPGDVKVIGFDDSIHASTSSPSMSTINQNMIKQGFTGAQLLWRKLNEDNLPRKYNFITEPLYRQSCGCIPMTTFGDVFKTSEGKLLHKEQLQKNNPKENRQFFNFLEEIDDFYALFDISRSAVTLKKLSLKMPDMMKISKISNMAVCFFDKPKCIKEETDFSLPGKMTVSMILSSKSEKIKFDPGITFDPSEVIFPDNIFPEEKGFFILQPIFSGELSYGYILCQLEAKEIAIYSIFLKILINTIAQAYEYTTTKEVNELLSRENLVLQKDNTSLNMQKNTDELSHILNRRGFLEYGQRQINIATEMNTKGLVIYGDMDGLKRINDTYGHEMGDAAIECQAQVLSHSFRINDIVARIGGDEFAAVAVGMSIEQLPKLRKKIEKYSIEFSKQFNLPFTISCSVGAAEFSTKMSSLQELLAAADKELYEEKRIKHAESELNRI